MALVLTCESSDLSFGPSGEVYCTTWQTSEYISADLVTKMDELLGFDLEVYGLVEGALIISFLIGHYAGKVARVLGRT